MTTADQERSVGGTVFHDGKPRILSIKGIKVDAEFTPSMIYVTNDDKPGFIGRFASCSGDAGVNIATFALGRDEPGGSAIALVSIDGEAPPQVLEKVGKAQGRAAGDGAALLKMMVGTVGGMPARLTKRGDDCKPLWRKSGLLLDRR